jgi:predicted ATP-grasp superfamily ATP-dependent carboligase
VNSRPGPGTRRDRPRVLVTEGYERHALAIVRSLGRRDIHVTVGGSSRYTTASLSKYCRGRVKYVSPETDGPGFVSSLLEVVKRGRYDVLMPVTDYVPALLADHLEEFSEYTRVAMPPRDIFLRSHDKKQTVRLAQRNGIPCPRTIFVTDLGQLEDVRDFPVVIKPMTKTQWRNGRAVITKVEYARDAAELREKYAALHSLSPFPMLQEYIPGESGYGVNALCRRGEPRAVFTYKRLREYPLTGGASTLRQGIIHPVMTDIALRLLKAMDWDGVAMVEFKIDSRDRGPKLMEVNGRFWGSLALPIAAGVDFPYLLFRLVTEGDVEPVLRYSTRVKARWLLPGDLLWLAAALRARPDRIATLRQFFDFRNEVLDVFAWDDPLPLAGACLDTFKLALRVAAGHRALTGGTPT